MAGAPAYRYPSYYGTAAPKLEPERRPDIAVIPGRAPRPSLNPHVHVAVRVLVAIVLILAVAAGIRLGFMSATVTAEMSHQEVAMDLNAARAQTSALEVQASNLSNPAYVREYASSKLGMQAPDTVETLALGPDVVAVDETGALSLSESLAAVARG